MLEANNLTVHRIREHDVNIPKTQWNSRTIKRLTEKLGAVAGIVINNQSQIGVTAHERGAIAPQPDANLLNWLSRSQIHVPPFVIRVASVREGRGFHYKAVVAVRRTQPEGIILLAGHGAMGRQSMVDAAVPCQSRRGQNKGPKQR